MRPFVIRNFTVMLLALLLLSPAYRAGGQIIADHTVVDQYDQIPQQWIDSVKTMWLSYAGESHSAAIRAGLSALEDSSATYAVSVVESGTPEAATDLHLRVSRGTWGDLNNESGWIYSYGEEDWFTSETAISRTKAGISYCKSRGLDLKAFGFGWCWDSNASGPDYISATKEYIDYCADSIDTQIFFTTGPVDGDNGSATELSYNVSLKWQLIRDTVANDATRVLFDYADILCYNNAGELETTTWDGHTFPVIHPDNMGGGGVAHIGYVGAVRLAKAMWWMLARMAGWDPGALSVQEKKEGRSRRDLLDGEGFSLAISRDLLEIRMDHPPYGGTVSLWSLSGQLLSRQSIWSDNIQFETGGLPQGIYLITVSSRSDLPRSGIFFLP